jgi:hypothetical protein
MDEILDAEYKVVEHQIAPPLDPSPRWRFQQLSSPKWPAMRSSSPKRTHIFGRAKLNSQTLVVINDSILI